MLIPRIIHQTWKDDAPPARLASFQSAWRRLHPQWTYRFWTDATTRAFVAEHYPDFLATYDGYREPIMRVDAARYLWMSHFGGVYADLDVEPVRAVDELLADARLAMAVEPRSHCRRRRSQSFQRARSRGLPHFALPPPFDHQRSSEDDDHCPDEEVRDGGDDHAAMLILAGVAEFDIVISGGQVDSSH